MPGISVAASIRLFGFVLVAMSGAPCVTWSEQPPKATVVSGFASPESVLISGGRRFVSNIGRVLDPVAKDGDGFISEVSADGQIVNLRAFPPKGESLNAPKGMAVAGARLYVADIDRVVGFDLTTGGKVFEAHLPQGTPPLANDLATVDENTLLVTDTFRNAVYRLDLGSGEYTELTNQIPGANGIAYDQRHRRAIVVGLGERFSGGDLFFLGADGIPKRAEKGPHGILDGLELLPDGRMVVSDWTAVDRPTPGVLKILSSEGEVLRTLDLGVSINGPADFAIDKANLTFWIPALVENTVVIVHPKLD